MQVSSGGMNSPAEKNEVTPGEARTLARALGIAWVGATLYANPLEQDAFGKAAERIAGMAAGLPAIDVVPRTLRLGDRDLGEEGLSIEKLAHSCFIHGINLLRFTPELTPRSLATFMEVIQLDPEEVVREGGLTRLLRRRLVLGVEAFAHTDAMDRADELSGWDERWGWSAESLTAVLQSTSTDQLGPTLMDGFRGAVGLESVRERQAAVTSHVEALMNLRPGLQAEVLDWLFTEDEGSVMTIFDHLATHELLRLSQDLGTPARERALRLLEERGVQDPSWRPLDRAIVAASLDIEIPGLPPSADWQPELAITLDHLLEFDRDDREGLIDPWVSLFDSMLEQGLFAAASNWLQVPARVDDPGFQRRVAEERQRMPSQNGLRYLVAATGRQDAAAASLLLSCLESAPAHVLDLLGGIPDPELVLALDVVAGLPGEREVDLLDHLPHSARPLTVALGLLVRRGLRSHDDRLVSLLDHVDPAVRAAAVRLVGPEVPVERLAGLLADVAEEVQHLAADELMTRGSDAVTPLGDSLRSVEMPDALAATIAAALLEMPGGAKALERVAQDVQLLVSGTGRARRRLLLGIVRSRE